MEYLGPGILLKGGEQAFAVIFPQGRKTDGRIGYDALPEILVQGDLLVLSEIEAFQFVFDEKLFGNLNGVFFADEHAQGVVPEDDHIPLVIVGNESGGFHGQDQVDAHIDERHNGNQEILVEPGFGFLPGDEDQQDDDQGEGNGHDQPPHPNPVGIFLVVKFHFFLLALSVWIRDSSLLVCPFTEVFSSTLRIR